MSAFSDRVRANRTGLFKVADFDGGKEQTFTISHLDEAMEMFGKTVDLLNFQESARQLQLNQSTSEWLLDNFGDDPAKWPGKKVVLHLGEYKYEGQTKKGIRLKLPGKDGAAAPAPKKPALSRPEFDDEIPY